MGRVAILRHELPDGSYHFDLLIEPETAVGGEHPDERVLIAWRLPRPPSDREMTVRAERLPPHRRVYLGYEGPVSAGRGEVWQMDSGAGEILADAPDRFWARLTLGEGDFEVEGSQGAHGAWSLRITPLGP